MASLSATSGCEVRDGKVSRLTEYFANPFEAPAWRASIGALRALVHRLAAEASKKTYIRAVSSADRMPEFIPPMNATLVAAPFDDPDWLFEVNGTGSGWRPSSMEEESDR